MQQHPNEGIIIYRRDTLKSIYELSSRNKLEAVRKHLKPEYAADYAGDYLAKFNRHAATNSANKNSANPTV